MWRTVTCHKCRTETELTGLRYVTGTSIEENIQPRTRVCKGCGRKHILLVDTRDEHINKEETANA